MDTLDYSRCTGHDCGIKEKCWRYTKPSSRFQSWIMPCPDQSVSCEYYIPVEQENND